MWHENRFLCWVPSVLTRNVTEGAEEEETKNLEEEEAEQQESEDPLLAIGLAFMPKMNQEEAVLVLGLQQK